MGFKLTLDGKEYQISSYSLQEASTPLAAGDSSGQVGTVSFSIPKPDPFIDGLNPLHLVGPAYIEGASVELTDQSKGVTTGKVTSISQSQDSATLDVSVTSRLGELNIFNIQTAPYVGSLSDAFSYYLSLAGITNDFFVDPTIASKEVAIPGWYGELWFHLKQLTTALQVDIALVSGVILLRPIRTRTATVGRDISRQHSMGGGGTAQFVEAYYYQNREIDSELVYPPGGWTPEVSTINVNAGEYIEEVIEIGASLWEVNQPVMQSFVGRYHTSSSVYTVSGDDGLNVDPTAWAAKGGSLTVEINPDTISLTVKIQAPTDLPSSTGEALTSFSIALGADDGRYSTLRITGSGVAFDRQILRTPTGLTAQETGTEVGATIDNPFFSTLEEAAVASAWAVRAYDGSALSLTGSVSLINKLGDSGDLQLVTYEFDQITNSGRSYEQVQTSNAGRTYLENFEYLNSLAPINYEDQVFGNVAGTRINDSLSARWYRIRSGTITPDTIQFEADDDTTHGDAEEFYRGRTYEDLQEAYREYTYRTVDLMGLR